MGKVAVVCAAVVCTAAVFVLMRAAVVCMVAAALTMLIRRMKCFRRNTVMCIARNISRKLGYAWGYPPELVFELHSMGTYLYCWLEWTDRLFGKVKHFEFHHLSDLQGGVQKISEVRLDFEASKLLKAIQQLKPRIKQDCLDFLNCPSLYNFYNDNPPPSMRDNAAILANFDTDKLSEFLRGIVAILGGLLLWKRCALSDVKVQIESLKDNLDLISEVLLFAKEGCCHFEEFEKFKIRFQVLAWKAAALSLLYWAQDLENEKMPPSMAVILSDLLKKSNPFTDPEVTPMHLVVLTKLSKTPPEIRFTTGRLAHKFVGALKVIQVDPENPAFQTLFIELIFLITFLMDRHQVKGLPEGESILTLVNNLVDEVLPLICSLNSGEIKEGIAEENNCLLHNFLEKANLVKAEVRKIYIHIFSDLSSFNFPRINMNVLRFIDLLLENLKGSCFRFPNLPIMMLREELLSLKELNFEDFSIAEIQNKHREIKDLWARLVKMAYNAERAVNSFMYMKFLWHDILHFSDVIEELKLIKGEIKRIRDQPMYDIHASNLVKSSETLLPLQANIPTAEQVVGLKNEVQLLVDRLIEGPKELDIVSIVGMPGLGKTTLAAKVYVSVKFHFHQHAWCTVSQTFDSRRMLSEIARSIGVRDNDLSHEKEEDLAHKVYKSLKGQRYLIVMDDIWDVAAWNALKMSFPDDKIGSRIMFTSRIRELVSEARPGCVPFPLKPLTDNESWELLQKKLFDKDSCPTNCAKIGKQIATNCKGLPLSVILVAGLLKKNIEDMDWWEQVGERLDSLSVNEECKALLELSYKHLPEVLKPCFLYLGSFSEDEEIKVNSLVQLWVLEEGFIEKQESKSLEVVAEEYLVDLVGRSLVSVANISSTGKIKTCKVHDLLHEFCFRKGEEENIIKVFNKKDVSYNPYYRVCIIDECGRSFIEDDSSAPFVHSILPFPNIHWRPWLVNFAPKNILSLTSRFRFLQVLYFGAVAYFPEEIIELVLLKCLLISCTFKSVPLSIRNLENLETLELEGTSFLYDDGFVPSFPIGILEVQKLKHVFVRGISILRSFPDAMPPLENLRTFSCPDLRLEDGEMSEMFFRKMPNVEKLKCGFAYPGLEANLIMKLDFLSHLESLTLKQDNNIFFSNCELHFSSTLKKLHLVNFKLPWSAMSAISELPCLEVLKLDGGILGDTWNVEDEEFQNLKFLRLRDLKIKELNVSYNPFPNLVCFVVEWCKSLEEIPCSFASISTLKVIEVTSKRLEGSARQIQEDQKDLGNELQVISPGFESSSDSDFEDH